MSRQVQWTLLGGVVIFLVLGRCSPIAPSISKASLHGERPGLSGTLQSIGVQAQIVSMALPNPEDLPNLAGNALRLSTEQLDQLRKSNRSDLTLRPTVLGQPLALVRLNADAAGDDTLFSTVELTLNESTTGQFTLLAKDPQKQLARIQDLLLITDSNLLPQELLTEDPLNDSVQADSETPLKTK